MTSIEQAIRTFRNNVQSVDQLADLDRGLLDQVIQQLKERDARIKSSGADNPRWLSGNTVTYLENIREHDSLRPGFQALVNQSAVLLASYFASGVSQLFRAAVASSLEHNPSKPLVEYELKLTVKDLKSLGPEIVDSIPDLIAEGPGISFQDTQSIQRLFNTYLEVDIPRDEVTNDVSVELALRHVLVHNGGIVDRKCLRQTEGANPRKFRREIKLNESINFRTEEIRDIGATMILYVERLAESSALRGR